jgi:Uncharacterized distant relative of cell wall-associated hydrolases
MKPQHRLLRQNHTLLSVLASVGLLLFLSNVDARAESTSSFPPPSRLQTGDLIWPKKPNAIVPYNSRPGQANDSDAEAWVKERDRHLDELKAKPNVTDEEKARYLALRNMTYLEFVSLYLDDVSPGKAAPYAAGVASTGHVGIIQVIDGVPTVVEAMDGIGVRRMSYSDWTHNRPGELVWVGRLKDVSAEKRAAVAATAASYIGRPYHFWNFNLSDSTGFYCSKLAWFSILTGAGFAPDDDPNPNRPLWYSPKKLMSSKHIEMIVNPGSYGLPVRR